MAKEFEMFSFEFGSEQISLKMHTSKPFPAMVEACGLDE